MMTGTQAFIAAHRFGLGPRPEENAAIAADPLGWVRDQIGRTSRAQSALFGDRPRGAEAASAFSRARGIQRASRMGAGEIGDSLDDLIQDVGRIYIDDVIARLRLEVVSETPFTERLASFWTNHLTVSTTKGLVAPVAGAYEREAIRPHIYGRYADMVLASARHPAMLYYLDNMLSVGPNTRAGRRRDRGLNENYARELLELHTLGVDGGYDQTDIIELAKILTGWTLNRSQSGTDGTFRFVRPIHEPGRKRLLGRSYGPAGEEEGIAAIRDLARHPATATHIATKLARHFIADDPPDDAVSRIARTFRSSDGDLSAVYETLLSEPAAWEAPLAKTKTPEELVVAMLRFAGAPASDITQRVVMALREMGQQIYRAPSPQGWPDTQDGWIGPQALINRISVVAALSGQFPRGLMVNQLAEEAIGAVAYPDTLLWISRAPDSRDGLAMLFASAEFQSR